MSLEQAIELNTLAMEKLTAALTSNLGQAAFSAAANAESEAKPAPKSRSRAAAKTETKAAPADEFDDLEETTSAAGDDLGLDDDDLGLDDEPETKVTKEDLKGVFQKLAKQKGGREAVQDVLKSLKATSFTDLKEADFAAAYAKVTKALA